jgi:hypothetical protein
MLTLLIAMLALPVLSAADDDDHSLDAQASHEADLKAARIAAGDARAKLAQTVRKLLAQAPQTQPAWAAAVKQLNDATAAQAAARARVMAALKKNADYLATVSQLHAAVGALGVAHDGGHDTPGMYNAITVAKQRIKQAEADALAADPQWKAATDQIADANATIKQFKAGFDAALPHDPVWLAAHDAAMEAENAFEQLLNPGASATQPSTQEGN